MYVYIKILKNGRILLNTVLENMKIMRYLGFKSQSSSSEYLELAIREAAFELCIKKPPGWIVVCDSHFRPQDEHQKRIKRPPLMNCLMSKELFAV